MFGFIIVRSQQEREQVKAVHLFREDRAEVGDGRVVRCSFVGDLIVSNIITSFVSGSVQATDCSGYEHVQRLITIHSIQD